MQIINGEIVHYADRALNIGEELCCEINWEQRFRRMQNHSGEHIVSGIVHKLYGYENVGFHLGDDVTIDFDGELTREQLIDVEKRANEAIYKNAKFTCEYPDEETLKNKFVNLLIGDIIAGKYAPGTALPSERELSEKLGVSRSVVRSGLAELSALEGVILIEEI